MATLDEALQTLPFWDKLTDEQKQMARTASRIVPYKKGEMIHSCTGECLGLIAVQTGKIRAYMTSEDGREIALYRLYEGDSCVLAASCVIRQITFDVQLVADVDTELLVLNAHAFSQLSKQNVYVECCMYKLATERFSDVMWSMQQLLFTSFDKRLAQHLWDESQQGREPILATHEQLAKDTGAVRETVTRMLRSFAEDGMVKLGRGSVTITDRDKMKKLALM